MAVAIKDFGGRYRRLSETSAANTALSVTTPSAVPHRLLFATVKYSAAPTQAGVTTEIDSGVGAGSDVVLNTGAANAQATVYAPDAELRVADGDAFKVTAPAGGAGITASIVVYVELL